MLTDAVVLPIMEKVKRVDILHVGRSNVSKSAFQRARKGGSQNIEKLDGSLSKTTMGCTFLIFSSNLTKVAFQS